MSYSPKESGSINQYLYNNKEFQDEQGLNWYDYGARFYDPQIGRWHSQDPMADNYTSLCPYQYCGNNPIKNVDIGGLGFIGAYGMWDETGASEVTINDYEAYANSARNVTGLPNAVVQIGNSNIDPGDPPNQANESTNSGGGDNENAQSGEGGSSIVNFINQAQYSIPVCGACRKFGDCINSGGYLGAGISFTLAFAEAFTFGYSTEITSMVGSLKIPVFRVYGEELLCMVNHIL